MLNKLQFRLNKAFAGLFLASFLWIFILFFTRGSVFKDFNRVILVIGGMAVIAFFFVLFKLGYGLQPAKPRFTVTTLITMMFCIYIVLQVIFATELYTNMGHSWDFGIVASSAWKYVAAGVPIERYFNQFPNNIPLLMLFIGVFKLSSAFGYNNFINLGIFMNMVSINASILLTYFAVKKIIGTKTAAVVAMLVMMLTIPLLGYIAIYYTDTLTLIYPILSIYLWICAKQNINDSKNRKAYIQIAFAVVSAVVGGLLKISVLIVLVAIVIDAILSYKIKKSAIISACIVALFATTYLPSYNAIMNAPILPEKNINDTIPWTHWVMMGLGGNGNYNDKDYKMTKNFPAEERKQFISGEISRRLKDYGFAGLMEHLSEKNAFVWADGTFYTPVKVTRDRVAPSSLDNYMFHEYEYFAYYGYYCQFFMLAMVIGFLIAAIFMFFNKKFAFKLLPFALSTFGIFIFQMIWEARSRYLLNFLPIFIVLSVCAYEALYNKLPEAAQTLKPMLKLKKADKQS